MNSALILSCVDEYVKLDEAETEFFESLLIPRPFKQGEEIVRSGDVARYMMFLNTGYLMTYFTDASGADHVVQFATTGWWCGDIYSATDHATTPYSTRGLTDGEVLLLPRLAQQELLKSNIKFERYFRNFFMYSVLRHQRRFIENNSLAAEERYLAFTQNFPGLEQYVAQKHIASFLGITPEFLSKTRKKIAGKKS